MFEEWNAKIREILQRVILQGKRRFSLTNRPRGPDFTCAGRAPVTLSAQIG
jgi:hypothetical protein